jgi:hypothetical protein
MCIATQEALLLTAVSAEIDASMAPASPKVSIVAYTGGLMTADTRSCRTTAAPAWINSVAQTYLVTTFLLLVASPSPCRHRRQRAGGQQ